MVEAGMCCAVLSFVLLAGAVETDGSSSSGGAGTWLPMPPFSSSAGGGLVSVITAGSFCMRIEHGESNSGTFICVHRSQSSLRMRCVSLHRCLFSFWISLSDRRRSRLSEDTRWNTNRTRNNAAGLGFGFRSSGRSVSHSSSSSINQSPANQPKQTQIIAHYR